MKLKYKKIIILTAMSTMGIGLLTLSISHEGAGSKASLSPKTSQEAQAKDDTRDITSGAVSITPTVSPTPSPVPSPTPTPYPVYPLQNKCSKVVKNLIKNYYAAKLDCNTKKLKSMLTNSSKAESQKQIKKKTEYIEDYRKIKCFVKKGIEKDSYIVYVYSEVKITGINTAAPGLAKFYIVKNSKGKYKIFTGDMKPDIKQYYDERNNDADVQKLINETNSKSKKAKKKDADLAKFWKDFDKMAKSHKKNVKSSKK